MTVKPDRMSATLSAEAILAIAAERPEALFTQGPESIKETFRALAMRWHPDRNKDPKAVAVFAHLAILKGKAETKAAKGEWHEAGVFTAPIKGGRKLRLKFVHEEAFELGQMFIGEGKITYVVAPEYKDLADNYVKAAKRLDFANEDMRKQFAPQVPQVVKTYTLEDERRAIIIERAPDTIALKDVLAHFGGKLDPKHVAWITSRLLSFACYLQWAGINHNGLNIENCFVSPAQHTLFVPGGWFYSVEKGAQLTGLPEKYMAYAPQKMIEKGKSEGGFDRAMVRIIARQLLGDITGVRLSLNPEIPARLAQWLAVPAANDAFANNELWQQKILPESFGQRRFTVMHLHPRDVYRPKL